MATQNRYAVLLSQRGKQSTANIYAQLQAPAQRAAVQKTLNDAIAKGVPEAVTDPFSGVTQLQYQKAATYDAARRSADVAAYKATIDPQQLVSAVGKSISPSNVQNAYINPVAEGLYDYTPQFDWMGRQIAGLGSKTQKPTAADAMMYDLKYGLPAQRKNYDDALSGAKSAAEYQNAINQTAYEMARIPQARFSQGGTVSANGTQGYYDSYGTFIPLSSIGAINPSNTGTMVSGLLNPQLAPLSESFYRRGGHDSPDSFPAGFRY